MYLGAHLLVPSLSPLILLPSTQPPEAGQLPDGYMSEPHPPQEASLRIGTVLKVWSQWVLQTGH